MAWDGEFSTSKYKKCNNMVNEVLENDGCLVHEPTADGYTHEVRDRGKYLSDDYYFPNGRGGHNHYEHRSNGEVLKNGKPVKWKP